MTLKSDDEVFERWWGHILMRLFLRNLGQPPNRRSILPYADCRRSVVDHTNITFSGNMKYSGHLNTGLGTQAGTPT